ncbi:hypothetical protein BH24ACI5_BH24ACI5_18560 [soil metagenome]
MPLEPGASSRRAIWRSRSGRCWDRRRPARTVATSQLYIRELDSFTARPVAGSAGAISLSIGYSTCHWCHVGEDESFENDTIAAFLSQHFVSIKVDRESSISPDGRFVVYVSDESGRPEVYAVPLSGGGARVVVSLDGGTGPVWSRDGREIFYRSGDNLVSVEVRIAGALVLGARRILQGCSRTSTPRSRVAEPPRGARSVRSRG